MRIAQVCPGATWGEVNEETLDRGLGGRETAAIQLALNWGRFGHRVTVFALTETPSHHYFPETNGEVHFVEFDLAAAMVTSFQWDAVLTWEAPEIFALPGVREASPALVCGMQVAHVREDGGPWKLPDVYVALSPWHAEFLQDNQGLERPIVVRPNGIDLSHFPPRKQKSSDNSATLSFLYSSSPDRGLIHLLRSWPKFRERFPGCTLHVCYGIEQFVYNNRFSHSLQGEMAVDIERLVKQPGITYHGKIGQRSLATLHSSVDALLYPCDPMAPTETGCITVIEACAGGAIPIITDADCLLSEFASVAVIVPLPYDEDTYIDAVADVMRNPQRQARLRKDGRLFAMGRQWSQIARTWITLFEETAAKTRELAGASH